MVRQSDEADLPRLMVAGLGGDAVAHKTLLGRLSGHLRAYFRKQLARANRGPFEAEDLLQEVLLAVHTQRHTYDPSQLFTRWLYAIARCKFFDFLRRTKAARKDLPIEGAAEVVADDDTVAADSAVDLSKLMAGLPAKARAAVQFVKLDGLSVSEAAARSGLSESAVKVSLHRGLKALALAIRKGGGS